MPVDFFALICDAWEITLREIDGTKMVPLEFWKSVWSIYPMHHQSTETKGMDWWGSTQCYALLEISNDSVVKDDDLISSVLVLRPSGIKPPSLEYFVNKPSLVGEYYFQKILIHFPFMSGSLVSYDILDGSKNCQIKYLGKYHLKMSWLYSFC